MEIIKINDALRAEIVKFRGKIIVSRGKVHSIEKLPGYIALMNGEIKGLITFNILEDDCEIVSLDSKVENQGIGTKLIDLVVSAAKQQNCKRVWLITSNDNIRAIRFYQKRGFDMKAIHRDAITEARKMKPTIPMSGYDGIPIRHEIEFELLLDN